MVLNKQRMKRQKVNIILLSFFQLLVFTYPIMVKSGHHHIQANNYVSSPLKGESVAKYENNCPICNFEFVQVLLQSNNPYGVFLIKRPLISFAIISAEYRKPFTHFAQRAPPLS